MSEHVTANEDGTFTVTIHGPVADRLICLEADNAAKDRRIKELEVQLSGQTCFVPPEFQAEMDGLRRAATGARQVLWRYRHETPIGSQPYMIAGIADQAIADLYDACNAIVKENEND